MKKRLLALLLAVCLLTGLTGTAIAAEKSLPSMGQSLHGFRVTGRGTIDLLGAPTVTLEHEKSGAMVYFIAADDSNRTFDITFRTPAVDDRGMSHILEHSSLSGSASYPSPNLFFAAANQTYNTFVNAVTDEISTDYPVASLSEPQLLKLMDLYLDGVFRPMMKEEERVFQREAWRYELSAPDAPLTLTGTVYNEMKGAVDISRAAGYNNLRTLFPGTILSNNSGGNPNAIPNLTWAELADYHDTYYVPNNALITLYGDLDLDNILQFLDSAYLSDSTRSEVIVDHGAGTPLSAPATARYEFPAQAGTDADKGTCLGYGMAVYDASGKERTALLALTEILASEASPVAQAVAKALPGAAFSCQSSVDYAPSYVMFTAQGVDEGAEAKFKNAVDAGLTQISREGLDPTLVDAALSQMQFNLRALNESSQKGPSLSMLLSKRWAAEGNLNYLNEYQKALVDMKGQTGYFESLIKKYLIGNPASALSATVPVPGLKERQDELITQRLAEKKAAMTDAEIAAMVKATADFNAWSAKEPDPKLVDSLKAVSVKELPERLVDYPISDRAEDGIRYLTAIAPSSGLCATSVLLDLSGLSTEDLRWVNLYGSLVGQLGAGGRSAGEVTNQTSRYLGAFSSSLFCLAGEDSAQPYLMAQFIGMPEEFKTGLTLLGDLLFHTTLSDTEAIGGLVTRLKNGERDALNQDPGGAQMLRVKALTSPGRNALYNEVAGLSYLAFLEGIERDFKTNPAGVLQKLKEIQGAITNRQNAISLFAGDETASAVFQREMKGFWSALPQKAMPPVDRSDLILPARREAIVAETAVQANLVAAPLEALGLADSGKLPVLGSILTDQYLIPQMRHVLGAYGADASLSRDGVVLSTYRDPSVEGAYEVFAGAGKAMEALKLNQSDLDGYILSAYSAALRPRGVLTGAMNTMVYKLQGISTADREQELREMKTVTLADVHDLGSALSQMSTVGVRSTAGGAAAVEENSGHFDVILYPNGRNDGAPLTRARAISLLYGGAPDAMAQAIADGIVQGTGDGNQDSRALTREELAVMQFRKAGAPPVGSDAEISDLSQISAWAREAARWAVTTGVMSLGDDGAFHPAGTVSEADLAH